MLGGYAGWHKQYPSGGLEIFGKSPMEGQKQVQHTKVASFSNPCAWTTFTCPRNGPIDSHALRALDTKQAKGCGKLLHRQALPHRHDLLRSLFACGKWRMSSDSRRTRGRLEAAARGIMFQLKMADLCIGDVLEAQRPTVRQLLREFQRDCLFGRAQLVSRAPVSASYESKSLPNPWQITPVEIIPRPRLLCNVCETFRWFLERHTSSKRLFTSRFSHLWPSVTNPVSSGGAAT
ncbi:hypothetical protein LX32DRAFT_81662 [Colletotrichum zoysiae]|uniref:Uncharacterized protein n=1 Tax=Colletotrichum zoysiae TaxID=1216348 RepID=A0AAD9HBD8_9PEZI|nr:hypothetical protein LX32DRAFT_81662 [Colletotrichum zoysiae]